MLNFAVTVVTELYQEDWWLTQLAAGDTEVTVCIKKYQQKIITIDEFVLKMMDFGFWISNDGLNANGARQSGLGIGNLTTTR